MRPTHHHLPTRGLSYVEVCLAMAILTLCILPAARALPTILAGQRYLQTQHQLSLIAQEKLEAALLALQASFTESEQSGNVSGHDSPPWRYHVDVSIPTGCDGRYATVAAWAYVDTDADAQFPPEAGEPAVRFDGIAANWNWRP